MKKLLFIALSCTALCVNAQNAMEIFDYNQALEEAKSRGLQPVDYAGYIEFKHREWQKGKSGHVHNDHAATDLLKQAPAAMNAVNMDFEAGNYNGWMAFSGDNNMNSNGPLQNIQPMTPGPTDSLYGFTSNCGSGGISSRQGLITASLGNDPMCGIPFQSPLGGNYIARLNRWCAMFEGSILQQTFTVSPGLTWLNYAYSVILQDGGHLNGEQTYFRADVTDSAGNPIGCCQVYMQAANGTTPGFYPVPGTLDVYYKPWTPVSIDLSAYVGTTVTVKFTSAACIWGGHSGYAYVDARMDSVAAPGVVWPGDANYDLTADNNDLLYIGWGAGVSGTTRAGATTSWQPEPSANWSSANSYGVDYKHADTNGDGVIDMNDTLALTQNYAMTHPWKLGSPVQTNSFRNITLTPSTSNVAPGSTFSIDVDLGSSGIPAADTLYGISFTLSLPSNYINTMTGTDYSQSYLGIYKNDMITITKPFISSGYVDAALVRMDHLNKQGSGNLLRFTFQASNFTSGGNAPIGISNITGITAGGSFVPLGGGTTNINFSLTVNMEELHGDAIQIQPNPATESVVLTGLKNNVMKYDVTDITGKIALSGTVSEKSSIEISALQSGPYFIRLYSDETVTVKKFIKQ